MPRSPGRAIDHRLYERYDRGFLVTAFMALAIALLAAVVLPRISLGSRPWRS